MDAIAEEGKEGTFQNGTEFPQMNFRDESFEGRV
jgi:hypothetical protein